MSQLVQLTQKTVNKVADRRTILINCSRATLTEQDSSDTKIFYAIGVGGVKVDTIVVDDTYATVQDSLNQYTPGINIQVSVLQTENNVRSYTTSLEVDNIVYAWANPADAGQSVVMYYEVGRPSLRSYIVDQTLAQLLVLSDSVSTERKIFAIIPVAYDVDQATGDGIGGKIYLPMSFEVLSVAASCTTAGTTGTALIDVNKNGTTILSTKISIETGELNSYTATTQPVVASNSFTEGDYITFDVDAIQSGTAAKGLVVYLTVNASLY